MRAASRQQPRQRSGSLRGQKRSVSAPTLEHADCGQLSTERRREVASRGSWHASRSAERGVEGRRLTCACRALRPSLWAVRWKEGAVAAGRARAPRFLGRCYDDAPRHPALLGVADGGAPPRMRPGRGSAAPGRLGAERRCRLRSRRPEPEEAGIWRARSSGHCAPFTSALVAGAISTSPCRRAGQRDHRPQQAPR